MKMSMLKLTTAVCVIFVLCVTISQAQQTFVSTSFEAGEGFTSGSPVNGISVTGGTMNTGSTTEWLADNGNARDGTQSSRLSVGDSQRVQKLVIDSATHAAIDASTLPIELTYSVFRPVASTGGNIRVLMWGNMTGSGNSEEMTQIDLKPDGEIQVNYRDDDGGTGAGSNSKDNPGDLTGWYDFKLTMDFNKPSFERFQSAMYRAPGGAFTELMPGPRGFASPFACCTGGGGGGSQKFDELWFYAENRTGSDTHPDIAFDNISIREIPEPATSLMLVIGLVGMISGVRRR